MRQQRGVRRAVRERQYEWVREMDVGDVGDVAAVIGAGAVALVATALVVVVRYWLVCRAIGAAGRRITDLQRVVERSQLRHGTRLRGFESRIGEVERTVYLAEDRAHEAVRALGVLRHDLVPRLDRIERHDELATLVAEGRIPAEHLPPLDVTGPHPERPEAPDREAVTVPDDREGQAGSS
jgi:hypothetical protein